LRRCGAAAAEHGLEQLTDGRLALDRPAVLQDDRIVGVSAMTASMLPPELTWRWTISAGEEPAACAAVEATRTTAMPTACFNIVKSPNGLL